jgi:O-succinylbenzoate synthase
VNYRFQFRRYRLPLRVAVRTAHGVWAEREGIVVRLEGHSSPGAGQGRLVGFGEAAVIPWFGTETADEAEAACQELGEKVDAARLASVPVRLRCLRNALASARLAVGQISDLPTERKKSLTTDYTDHTNEIRADENSISEIRGIRGSNRSAEKGQVKDQPYLPVAALLPAGRAALAGIAAKAEGGFRVFKWKVGVGDIADELALLDDVCAALPAGAKLRLDANGAWDRRKAERWLERCAERPVEFLEQPIAADAKGAADLLLGLAGDWPTPLALDESVAGDGDIERWLGAGWPGVFVVKPSLLGDAATALEKLARAKAAVVFSSALETAVGARAALRTACLWPGERRALGFGVWPLFADARFDGPAAAPFLHAEDVERLNPEAVWNALS